MTDIDQTLTSEELTEIADYTIVKINSYPKSFGKTVENYFDALFPDELRAYIFRREINRQGEIKRQRRMSYV